MLLFNILKREENTGTPGSALERRRQVGQLPLEQHIGVRIPGGQPILRFQAVYTVQGRPKKFLLSSPQTHHSKRDTRPQTFTVAGSKPNDSGDNGASCRSERSALR